MDCPDCKTLFNSLADATNEHIRQLGRLQIATLRRDAQSVEALCKIVSELQATREQASQAYRLHRQSHEGAYE